MKKIFSVLMVVIFATALASVTAWGQTTYTWTGATDNSWLTTTNWTPTRTTPANNDIIQFNAGGTTTVTAVPTQTIGQLIVSGSSTVNLQAAGTVTLTITGTGTVLSVASGSALNCNVANAITINITTGGTGSISGAMTLSNAAHRLTAADASGVTFQSGSTFTEGTSFSGNPFGTTNLNSIVFASGSTFIFVAGSSPFGASQPSSVVVFQTGSLYEHEGSGTPSFSGRTYANFQLNIAATTITVTGGSAVSMNDLTITAGTLNFNMTGTPGHSIKGNISVASGQTLNFAPASAGTVNLNGSTLQSISGTGTITTNANLTINVNNSNGISLGTNLSIGGTLALTQGNVALGGNTLTLGTAIATPGTLTYTAGFLTGTGTFTRWFATAAISGNAGLFPMGVGSNNRSLAIGGSPSTGGPISVSYNDASTVSAITFTENVQSFVNRYDANWVVTPAGGYTDPAMTLTIHGDGIPGITNVADLDLSAATTIATGVWASPSGTTSSPVLTRNGLTEGTIITNPFYIASVASSPLPVELTSFTALAGKNNVELAWNTATEVNNYGFDVERRSMTNQQSTMNNWTKVGFVAGHGTTNAPQSYSYADNSVAFGTYSYRLKQIDHNGNFEYSKEVETAVTMTPNTIVLGQNYPNPFNPQTSIEFAVPKTGYTTLKIYNMLGQEVATLVNGTVSAGVMNQVSFNGNNLASGLYFYILRSGSFVDTKKMLLMK